jgi:hypothetical protein
MLLLSTLGKAKLMLDELPRLLVLLLSGGGSVTSVLMRLCLELSLMLLPWLLMLAELSVLSLSSLLLLPLLLIVEMSQQHHWAKPLQAVWQRANGKSLYIFYFKTICTLGSRRPSTQSTLAD